MRGTQRFAPVYFTRLATECRLRTAMQSGSDVDAGMRTVAQPRFVLSAPKTPPRNGGKLSSSVDALSLRTIPNVLMACTHALYFKQNNSMREDIEVIMTVLGEVMAEKLHAGTGVLDVRSLCSVLECHYRVRVRTAPLSCL